MSATKPPAGYDDRFVVPLEPSRRGAHRARVSPLVSALPVIAVMAVVVVVIVLAWTLFGHTTTSSSATAGVAASTPAATRGPAPSSPPVATASAPAVSSATATPTSSASATSKTDKTLPITVLNSSGIGGLARKVATKLEADGWTIKGAPGNATPARPTTIYYATNDLKVTAQAVLKSLGGKYRLRRSTADSDGGVAVVLGSDYVS